MSRMNLLSLVAISLLSLSLCSPVPDNHRFNSRYLSDGPRNRQTYSPTRHSRDKYTTLHQFPSSTYSPTSHFFPSSPSPAPINKPPITHNSSLDHQHRHSAPSFLSTITSYIARVFSFHHQTTPEPTPEESPITETPADNETGTQRFITSHHHIRQNHYSSPEIHTATDRQVHLERAKRLVEDALSQVDTSSNEDLSPEELFQMVHLWTRMFQAIERALTRHETATIPSPPTSAENEVNEEPFLDAPVTETDNMEEPHRNTLPDVKIALAQAELLNKQRETERQQKIAELENEQPNDPDYTDGLPKSAPSYPTRLKLQMEARNGQWPSLR